MHLVARNHYEFKLRLEVIYYAQLPEIRESLQNQKHIVVRRMQCNEDDDDV